MLRLSINPVNANYDGDVTAEFKRKKRRETGSAVRAAARRGELEAWRRALVQYLAAEAELLGGPPAGARRHAPRPLHEARILDEAAEILLVDMEPEQRLHCLLQFV